MLFFIVLPRPLYRRADCVSATFLKSHAHNRCFSAMSLVNCHICRLYSFEVGFFWICAFTILISLHHFFFFHASNFTDGDRSRVCQRQVAWPHLMYSRYKRQWKNSTNAILLVFSHSSSTSDWTEGHNGCWWSRPALSNQFGGQLCSKDSTVTIQLAQTLGTRENG